MCEQIADKTTLCMSRVKPNSFFFFSLLSEYSGGSEFLSLCFVVLSTVKRKEKKK